MFKKAVIVLSSALLIAGCSGSSSNDSAGAPTATGIFKDNNVAGLYYTSGGQSGYTAANGTFIYEVGQPVTFSVGGITIGTATGKPVVSPVDLVTGGDTGTPAVQNIVRFLVMLDENDDPSDGIQISDAVQAVAENWDAVTDFAAVDDTTLSALLLAKNLADQTSNTLPTAGQAQAHLEETLRCAYSGAFTGTYTGNDDYGLFGLMVDAETGGVEGVVYSTPDDLAMSLSSTRAIGYGQAPTFVSGAVSGGATFGGGFSSPNTVSGSWEDTAEGSSGTFSGSRIGGAINAAYRFTAKAFADNADPAAVIAFDVDAHNNITGVVYPFDQDAIFTLSGTLVGTDLSGTIADGDGTTFTGTLNKTTGDLNGHWSNAEGTGAFEGCGCRLN